MAKNQNLHVLKPLLVLGLLIFFAFLSNAANTAFLSDTTKTRKDTSKLSYFNSNKLLDSNSKNKFNKNSFTKRFSINNQLRNENFATNFQNPIIRTAPIYSRTTLQSNIIIFGLPFNLSLFYTTENNSIYNSNNFSFRFNPFQIRDDLYKTNLEEIKSNKRVNAYKKEAKTKMEKEILSKENELNLLKNKLENDINNQNTLDSLIAVKKENGNISQIDSLELEKEKKINEINETRKKIEAIQSIIENYNTKKVGLESELTKDTSLTRIAEMPEGYEKNKELLKRYSSLPMPLVNLFAGIKDLDIGITYPTFSEQSIWGTPIKGVNSTFETDKFFLKTSAGKSISGNYWSNLSQKPVFTRNAAAVMLGIGQQNSNNLFGSLVYFKDAQKHHIENVFRQENIVGSIGMSYQVLKKLLINGEWSKSSYKNIDLPSVEMLPFSSNNLAFKNVFFLSSSLNVKTQYKLSDNNQTEIILRQTGPGYKTLGNPFLRTNFREIQITYKQLSIKKKIETDIFYKENRDNISEFNTTTNRIKGYGIKMNTRFNKKPNLTLMYTPYQQGNNHPDSLLRTNNQISLLLVTINYIQKGKNFFAVHVLTATKSSMELNTLKKVNYSSYVYNLNATIKGKNNLSLTVAKNSNPESIDSLNSIIGQIILTKQLLNKVQTSIDVHHSQFKSGAFRSGFKVGFTTILTKQITCKLYSGYDHIFKLWGITNANVFTGQLIVLTNF